VTAVSVVFAALLVAGLALARRPGLTVPPGGDTTAAPPPVGERSTVPAPVAPGPAQ
jgi:hypothetical protein